MFAMSGKVLAKPGRRDAMVEILLPAEPDAMAQIAKARPLVAGFEGIRLLPVGGKGLP